MKTKKEVKGVKAWAINCSQDGICEAHTDKSIIYKRIRETPYEYPSSSSCSHNIIEVLITPIKKINKK